MLGGAAAPVTRVSNTSIPRDFYYYERSAHVRNRGFAYSSHLNGALPLHVAVRFQCRR
jgi:hypothetical protein